MSSTSNDDFCEKRARIAIYLHRQVQDGNYYFKSKFIADELDLSPNEIGRLMPELRESHPDLDIQKWGCCKATTWYVQLED